MHKQEQTPRIAEDSRRPDGADAAAEGKPSRGHWRRLVLRIAAPLAAVIAVATGITGASTAYAAAEGSGVRLGGVFVGAYVTSTNGSNAFCAEPDGDNPTAEVPATRMTSLRGYLMQSTGHWVAPYANEQGLRMMNYVTATYGTLGAGDDWQNSQAAAVALSIWTIRGWEDGVVAGWVETIRGLAPEAVRSLADRFVSEAAGAVTARIVPPAEPSVTWSSEREAVVTVPVGYERFHAASGGRLVGNAPAGVAFANDGTTATLDPARAHTLSIESLPTLSSPRILPLELRAEWSQQLTRWPAELWGFQPGADASDQLLVVGGGGEVQSDAGVWTKTVAPTEPRAFEPIVTTQVAQAHLSPGDAYLDRVTFGIAPGSAAWPSYWADGAWHPRAVRATGTLYGPLAERPEPAAQVPDDPAPPIVGTAVVEAEQGAGTYDVPLDVPEARAAGFYTWVWEVDGEDQPDVIQTGTPEAWHVAGTYRFQDGFGLAEETHLRPMEFTITTALRETELPPGEATEDVITVDPGPGGWLRADGEPAPVTFRATVTEVDGIPVRAPRAPDGATVRATERVTVSSADAPITVPVDVPLRRSGGVTVQVCVLAEDQTESVRELVVEGCDDWGVPEESARIVLPRVMTVAQRSGLVGQTIHDVASVRGRVPQQSSLGFTVYLQPEVGAVKMDAHWRPVLSRSGVPERWTATELARLDAREKCLAQPVARTARVRIEGPGEVRSPDVVPRSAGMVRWVEDLTVEDPQDRSSVELHRGICGAAQETTEVRRAESELASTGGATWGALAGSAAVLLSGAGLVALASRAVRPRRSA